MQNLWGFAGFAKLRESFTLFFAAGREVLCADAPSLMNTFVWNCFGATVSRRDDEAGGILRSCCWLRPSLNVTPRGGGEPALVKMSPSLLSTSADAPRTVPPAHHTAKLAVHQP